jgi:hypothetical protein
VFLIEKRRSEVVRAQFILVSSLLDSTSMKSR